MSGNIISAFLNKRQPDFGQILKVLAKGRPDRPTLFEFFHNAKLYTDICAAAGIETDKWLPLDEFPFFSLRIPAFKAMGYDYVTMPNSHFRLKCKAPESKASYSSSHNGIITDRKSFDEYVWLDPKIDGLEMIEKFAPHLPEGMKFIVSGPRGVLENVMSLVGYEDLAMMMYDDPELVEMIFMHVGQTLVDYYSLCVEHEAVGAIISNDDWGFNTQTMLSVDKMRQWVFPWQKKIVKLAHDAGKPAILHSCGQLKDVYDDIVDDMKFDGKHSYEDKILPVEQAYEQYKGRFAIMGGIDLDFVCRRTPEEVYRRSKAMLERSESAGGFALGTGNSVPEYVPVENFIQLIRACVE